MENKIALCLCSNLPDYIYLSQTCSTSSLFLPAAHCNTQLSLNASVHRTLSFSHILPESTQPSMRVLFKDQRGVCERVCVHLCVRVWRPKEGLVSCYYFISKSLLPSAKAPCFWLSSLFLLYRISKHYLFLYSLLNIIMWLF